MILLLCFLQVTYGLKYMPFSKLINYPPVSGAPVGPEVDGSPGNGVSSFPVINVRFSYPPTSVDVRRTKALASSQAFLIDQATKLSSVIESDTESILKNIKIQLQLAQSLVRAKSDKFTKGEKNWLKFYANYFPEVPPPSFIQRQQKNPQINIGVEDNTGEFKEGAEMNPREAEKFIISVSEEWMSDRRLVIELLKSYMQRISIVYNFLLPYITLAKVSSFAQKSKTTNNISSAESGSGQSLPVDMVLLMALRARVMQGGRSGATALAGLIDLWNEQLGFRQLIRDSHVIADCKLLLNMPKTPDYLKNLAGTLITLISGMPAASSSADFKSGSYGHVTVVVPRPSRTYLSDKQIAFAEGGD